jgi:hypothetical protein
MKLRGDYTMSELNTVELDRRVKKLSLLLYVTFGFCLALALAMMVLWSQFIDLGELVVHLQEKVIELRKSGDL